MGPDTVFQTSGEFYLNYLRKLSTLAINLFNFIKILSRQIGVFAFGMRKHINLYDEM